MFCWAVHLNGESKRSYYAAVPVEHKVYYFGRVYDGDINQIDLHIFNTVSLCWRKYPGGGERHLEDLFKRYGHTAVLIEYVIYIWGGRYSYCNTLYAFDVDTHRWFKPKVSGTVPEGRSYHSACVLRRVMYVHGGYTQLTGRSNDIYKLDTTTMVWSLINTRGTPAPFSKGHSAAIIGTKMFLFGGFGVQHYNTIRVFDTETNCWLSTPSVQLLRDGFSAHSVFTYNGELYIFGGCFDQSLNDLWKFNPETYSWKKVKPKGKGPCRIDRTSCCMVGDRIILFEKFKTTSDLFILDLSPSLKTLCKLAVIQCGLEQSELPHNIRWELAAMTTNSNKPQMT